jgi:hypothetical protein
LPLSAIVDLESQISRSKLNIWPEPTASRAPEPNSTQVMYWLGCASFALESAKSRIDVPTSRA